MFHSEVLHRPTAPSRVISPFEAADALSDIFSDAGEDEPFEEQKRGPKVLNQSNSFAY